MRTILLLFLFFSGVNGFCQMSSYVPTAMGRGGVATTFVTDYEAIGINPANLAYRENFRYPKVTFGFLASNVVLYSEAYDRNQVMETITQVTTPKLSYSDKKNAADLLSGSDLMADINILYGGVNVNFKKSGIAFSVSDRFRAFSSYGKNFSELIFVGKNASFFTGLLVPNSSGGLDTIPNTNQVTEEQREQVVSGGYLNPEDEISNVELFKDTRISASWIRQYSISYGLTLFESFDFTCMLGFGINYLQGFALVDVDYTKPGTPLSNIALSPTTGISIADSLRTFDISQYNQAFLKRLAFPKPIAQGLSYDVGIHMVFFDHLHLGAALTNYGKLTWKGDVFSILPTGNLLSYDARGLDNYNLANFNQNNLDIFNPDNLTIDPIPEIVEELPSTYRLGISYDFSRMHIGFDMLMAANQVAGNLPQTVYALGLDFRLANLFTLMGGLNTGGTNGSKFNFPAGITYHNHKDSFELSFAMADLGFFANAGVGNGSTFSFSSAVMRFKL